MPGPDELMQRVTLWVILVLSLTVHEWAHAISAWWLGDDTAERQGRVSLNPLVHIDPIGTLLPLLGVPFGWAKPVPINPFRFRKVGMRAGVLLTAAAGPASNVALLVILAGAAWGAARFLPPDVLAEQPVLAVIFFGMLINMMLACFNLLPIYPLDGSRIVDALLPAAMRPAWNEFCRLSPLLLIGVILLPRFLNFDLFGAPRGWVVQLFTAAVG